MKKLFGTVGALCILVITLATILFPSMGAWVGRQYLPSPADGNVVSLQNGTAFAIIRDAVKGGYGTQIMTKGDLAMFMKSLPNGWGFVVIDLKASSQVTDLKQIVNGGNFTNPASMSELVDFLRTKGWAVTTTAALPKSFIQAVNSTGSWLGAMNGSLFTLVVVPVYLGKDNSLLPKPTQSWE